MGEHEREAPHSVGGARRQVQVLDDEHAVPWAVKPDGPATSVTACPPWIRPSSLRWHSASRWVPICVVVETTSAIQLRSPIGAGFGTSSWRKWRPGNTGACSSSTRPKS
jgi:hypothetical protein